MIENDSVLNYACPIHKSLLQDNVSFGIGVIPAMLIFVITIILMRLVSMFCIFVGFSIFMIAKIATSKDPHLLEELFERLMISNIYRS